MIHRSACLRKIFHSFRASSASSQVAWPCNIHGFCYFSSDDSQLPSGDVFSCFDILHKKSSFVNAANFSFLINDHLGVVNGYN